MSSNISLATARNWARLNTDSSNKLMSRANKSLSKKTILPLEYLSDENNINLIIKIIDYISNNTLSIFDSIYSLGINILRANQLLDSPHVQNVLKEYNAKIDCHLSTIILPRNERDFLGLIYQSILTEGEKNKKGSYFTPKNVVANMISYISFSNNETFLDPCCGSGSFLLSLNAESPYQIFGIDNDPISAFICKINLLLKFNDYSFIPQIYCFDFLDSVSFLQSAIGNIKFDYIITNPPWGACCKQCEIEDIVSKETFSYFFVKAYHLLKENGYIRFLFPESIINVRTHKDIRAFMLSHGNLDSITLYNSMFTGVTTRYVDIALYNKSAIDCVNVYLPDKLIKVDKHCFYETENLIFNFHCDMDSQIIAKVKLQAKYTLSDSIWALGVVTGDNKKKLLKTATPTSEPIYTGKEILPYVLKSPRNFIEYKRTNFQQVAREEYYRATEKLVYKFISSKLVFAYDDNQSLFLNSANILIPKIPNMSTKTVLAFLNSELFQYLYSVLFSEVKILKGNLMSLPFPKITPEQDKQLSEYVQCILSGNLEYIEAIQNKIYDIFDISELQKKYIKEKMNGTFNK